MTATIHRLHRPVAPNPVGAFSAQGGTGASGEVDHAVPAVLVAQCQQIMLALCVFASRHGLPPPTDDALLLDAEAIASWPSHLWDKAYRALWQTWTYRRMPTVGDFRAVIASDLSVPASTPIGAPSPMGSPAAAAQTARAPGDVRPETPMTVEDCVCALQSASATAPGLLAKWWRAARSADPTLTQAEIGAIRRWAPLVAERISAVGLLGPVC